MPVMIPKPNHIEQPSMSTISNMSMISICATALDVCEYVYGDGVTPFDAIARFYETNAIYENPFLTATSRSVIADIHRMTRQLSTVDIPRPLAMFCTLFGLRLPPSLHDAGPLFRGLRVWTEIGDICENESFDGHRKTIIEHTLNVLLLPGIHCDGHRTGDTSDSLISTTGSPISHSQIHHPSSPSLPIPGTSLSIPSPFHFKLHVITRLSFNEQGRITHHRDFWDVKDVIGLVPGLTLAQWIGTRLATKGVSFVSRVWIREKVHDYEQAVSTADLDRGATPATAYVTTVKNALGIEDNDRLKDSHWTP